MILLIDKSNFKLTDILHALSDEKRLEIIIQLHNKGEQNCADFDYLMPKSTLTHHLKVLRDAGIINLRIEGVRHFYTLELEKLEKNFPNVVSSIIKIKGELK